ncbi:periplasmic protein TonB [Gammaproteobacteria bacterium]
MASLKNNLPLMWALAITLFFHFILIFQIRFQVLEYSPQSLGSLPTLEVVVAHQPSPIPIQDPDYLAQMHQLGGGDGTTSPHPPSVMWSAPASPEGKTQNTTRSFLRSSESVEGEDPETQGSETTSLLDADLLNTVSLNTSLDFQNNPSHRLRNKYISAHTQESKYVMYMKAWQTKVERIGNLNYPVEVHLQKLEGSLILDVAISSEGKVLDIRVVRSSGQPLLDQSAIQIVQQSIPFDSFPSDIRKDTDILHITRTWEFKEGTLRSQEP